MNYLLGNAGIFLIGYKAILPQKYTLGEADFDLLNDFYAKGLRDLPISTIFLKQDIFKNEKLDTSLFSDTNFLEHSTKEHFKDLPFLNHQCNFFFILPNGSIKNERLKNPYRPPNKKMFLEFDEKIKNFITQVNQSVQYFNSIQLTGGEIIQLIPFEEKELEAYHDYLQSGLQNYDVDIKNDWKYLKVGNQFASVLYFPQEDKFPASMKSCKKDGSLSSDKSIFYKNYGDNFGYDINFTHIYNQIAVIDDNKIHYQKAVANNNNLKKFRKFDPKNEFLANETDLMLNEMAKNQDVERIIRGHNNVVVFASSENELENRINQISERFKDIDIREKRAFGDNLMALYEYSFPLNCHLFLEEHFYLANLEIFASLLTSSGPYKSDEQGVLYNSRLGNIPLKLDIWNIKGEEARNFMIFAPTGGGKSFNANHIITYHYNNGAKQVIVDLGDSYKKLAALFPEDIVYVSYQEGQSLGINPFKLDQDEQINSLKIEELVKYICVHYRRTTVPSDIEIASLKKIVKLYYDNIEEGHSLIDFVQKFKQDYTSILESCEIKKEQFNVDEFLLMMSEFIEGGIYDFLYKDSESNLMNNFKNKKIIVFELDKIKESPILLSIMLQLISASIDKMVWQDKTTKGIIWFDEVGKVLQWEGMLQQLAWFYQAGRKQVVSIGIILQSESQLPENGISKSMIENTQLMYVLGAKDYRALQKRFDLSEHAYYMLNSLSSNTKIDKPYTEIFIKRGKQQQVYRLQVSKENYWAYQTSGKANELLLMFQKKFNSIEKAINFFVENEKELLTKIEMMEVKKETLNDIFLNYTQN